MTFLIRFSFFLLVLLASIRFAVSQEAGSKPSVGTAAEAAAINWKNFESPEGRFTMQFPGTPRIGTEPIDPSGQVLLHKSSLTTKAEYGVIYEDYPMKIEGPECTLLAVSTRTVIHSS